MRDLRAQGTTLAAAVGQQAADSLFIEILETDLTLQMEPKPGALEVIGRLAERHELIVVTARHEHEARAPRRWLQQHGIRVAQFIPTNRAPKATVAETHGLAVHLDDTPAVLEHFEDHATLAALYVDAAWPRAWRNQAPLPAYVREIDHWRRFERLVGELADGA